MLDYLAEFGKLSKASICASVGDWTSHAVHLLKHCPFTCASTQHHIMALHFLLKALKSLIHGKTLRLLDRLGTYFGRAVAKASLLSNMIIAIFRLMPPHLSMTLKHAMSNKEQTEFGLEATAPPMPIVPSIKLFIRCRSSALTLCRVMCDCTRFACQQLC